MEFSQQLPVDAEKFLRLCDAEAFYDFIDYFPESLFRSELDEHSHLTWLTPGGEIVEVTWLENAYTVKIVDSSTDVVMLDLRPGSLAESTYCVMPLDEINGDERDHRIMTSKDWSDVRKLTEQYNVIL